MFVPTLYSIRSELNDKSAMGKYNGNSKSTKENVLSKFFLHISLTDTTTVFAALPPPLGFLGEVVFDQCHGGPAHFIVNPSKEKQRPASSLFSCRKRQSFAPPPPPTFTALNLPLPTFPFSPC